MHKSREALDKQQLAQMGISDVVNSLRDWVKQQQQEAWDKMGDTGNYDYTTPKMNYNEENYWFGYFRALENLESRFFEKGSVCKCPICSEEMKGIELIHYKCEKCNEYFTN